MGYYRHRIRTHFHYVMNKHIDIVTPVRLGGPQSWGRTLTVGLTQRGWEARHVFRLTDVLQVPLHTKGDVVHSILPLTYHLWKKPVVLTILGNYTMEHTPWSWMYPHAIQKADVVTVSSEFLKQTLELHQAVVVPLSVELPQLTEKKPKTGQLHILMVTKFHFPNKAKGVLQALQAISALKKKTEDIRISVIGGGHYLKQIQEEAARRFRLPVQFYGFCDPKPFLQCADLFVYWSEHDNTPIAILEAMSYGLPVVTNNVGAVAELIRHQNSGLIAEDLPTFQEYVSLLLEKENLRIQIGAAARASIMHTFNHSRTVPMYEEIYRRLI